MITFLRGTHPKLLLCLLLVSGSFSTAANAGWKIKFDQSGSNPVIADDVLYLGSADGAVYALDPETGKTKWRFQTGEGLSSLPQVISVPRGTSIADQMAAGMSAAEEQRAAGIRRVDMTPAVENGTVFIGSGDHSFYAIDAATGKMKWSYVAGFGMASSNNTSYPVPAPVLKNGTVYFVTEDGLHALDALTGKRKWLFETLQEIPVKDMNLHRKREPSAPVLGDGIIFLTAWPYLQRDTPRKSFLYAVAPESGTTRWVTTLDGTDITAPVAAKGLVFVAIGPSMYAINAVDGKVRWKLGEGKALGTPRLLVAGNIIYFSTDKSLLAAELETGRQLWSYSADEIHGDLKADDQHLYVISHKGSFGRPKDTLYALALTTGQERWSQKLSGLVYSVLVHDGVVYAGRNYLHAIDAVTGKKIWSFKGTGRESAPVISDGRILLTSPTVDYFGTSRVDQGYLYAIDAKTGKP